MPASKGRQPDEKFPLKLTVKQRDSLVHATRLPTGIKERIKQASAEQPVVEWAD
jgi:hypothetical protein